jgi:hypothetical protein
MHFPIPFLINMRTVSVLPQWDASKTGPLNRRANCHGLINIRDRQWRCCAASPICRTIRLPFRTALQWAHARPHPPSPARTRKITFAEMRSAGVRGILVYCSDYRCSNWTRLDADRWPDDVRLSDIEPLFTCQVCGLKGAAVRPNFDWEIEARRARPRETRGGLIPQRHV